STPAWILMPGVVLVAMVGVYSINHSPFDLLLMTAFGVAGYVLRKMDFPLVPVVLGILLGGLLEINLRRALSISAGDWSVLVSSNLAIGLWIAGALMLVATVVLEIRRLRGKRGWMPEGVDD
ncbi:MAG TPA: tripartite tricarboxylate transporter permease, partial [Thalassobaculum sp.]